MTHLRILHVGGEPDAICVKVHHRETTSTDGLT